MSTHWAKNQGTQMNQFHTDHANGPSPHWRIYAHNKFVTWISFKNRNKAGLKPKMLKRVLVTKKTPGSYHSNRFEKSRKLSTNIYIYKIITSIVNYLFLMHVWQLVGII